MFAKVQGRLKLGLLLAAAGAALAGCSTFERTQPTLQAPDFIKVTRLAPLDLTAQASNWTQALGRPFQAEGAGAVPELAGADAGTTASRGMNAGLARLAAQAEARRAALRALAAGVMKSTDSLGRTLGGQLKDDSARKGALAEALETGAKVEYRDLATTAGAGRIAARATLDGRTLPQALRLNELTAKPGGQELNSARERARDAALELAKTALREQLLGIKLEEGKTLGEQFKDDASAMNEIDAMIFLLQPDELGFMPDGAARVTLIFDRNQARQIAQRHAGAWHWRRLMFWRKGA